MNIEGQATACARTGARARAVREILAAHPWSPSVRGYGSPALSPAIDAALAQLGDLLFTRAAAATAACVAFFSASPRTARVLSGALVQGFPQPDGPREHGVFNGLGLFVLTHMIVIGATLLTDVSIAPIVTA
ncbi:hypothetical protein [Nannocystis pusilla]|uniref:Uncharacterized protein n=1 Tax=Nannocystis pusilla TaxID=889268 RepID=A0ABS7TWB3_9BACT|nr:hypothetical protein [Nannocystis pusilla]MBZ5712476.1 hypothetical protein [Nannocystis pusilla]